jgi:ribonuclease T
VVRVSDENVKDEVSAPGSSSEAESPVANQRSATDATAAPVENAAGADQPPGEERRTGIAGRFRGFLPVIVDVETGGFHSTTDALLEIAAILVRLNPAGDLELGERFRYLVKPFEGSRLDPASLQITGIDPFHPLRPAVDEGEALRALFNEIRKEIKEQQCNRAILVGHNSFFDLQFLNAAVERTKIKRNPFHPFSTFDTVTLAGVAYGQTVLGRAIGAAGFEWNDDNAHSALYDAEKTGELFCTIVNRFRPLYGG